MKATLLVFTGVAALLPAQDAAVAPARLLSFNIRYGTADDGANHWSKRRLLSLVNCRW